jgi:glutathione peroxidase
MANPGPLGFLTSAVLKSSKVFPENRPNFGILLNTKLSIMKTFLIAMIVATTLPGGSIYDFKVAGLDGNDIDFSKYKGKKIMIVNTASECGNTPQYKDLETLYEKYKDKLVIVGFPANNFGAQEPGSNEEIKAFCSKNYGVTFPMAGKISVKGDDIHPLYKWLVDQSKEIAKDLPANDSKDLVWKRFMQDPVIWNFTKFLLDENGKLIAVFHHKSSPMSEEVLKYLKN